MAGDNIWRDFEELLKDIEKLQLSLTAIQGVA
jgi:hypothetical protein